MAVTVLIMKIRQLEQGDATIAQAVVKQFHDQEVSTDYMRKFLTDPANFLVTVEVDHVIAGFILAHRIDSMKQEAEAMFIYEIEVLERYRRQGVGSALINHIRAIANQRQMFEMFVFTNHSNKEAVAFYRATGGQIEEGDELMFVYPLKAG